MTDRQETRYIPSGSAFAPSKREHVYGIVSPRPNEPHCVGVILSNRWLKVWTHFRPNPENPAKGWPEPHWEPARTCEGCQLLNQTPRGKFVAPVFFPANSRVCVLEVCEKTPEYEPLLIDPKYDWRLSLVRAWRIGKGRKSRCGLEITRKAEGKFPICPPVTPTLENIWRLAPGTLPAEWNDEIRGAA